MNRKSKYRAPDDMMPSEEELLGLPRWARIAFFTRVARRVQPRVELYNIPERWKRSLDLAIADAERCAAFGTETKPFHDLYPDLAQPVGIEALVAEGGRSLEGRELNAEPHHWVFLYSGIIMRAQSMAIEGFSWDYLDESARHLAWQLRMFPYRTLLERGVRDDIDALIHDGKEHSWSDATSVAPDFFVCRPVFDVAPLIDVGIEVNRRLLNYFRRHPERLFDLTGRQFEEVMAELWDAFGFSVELTSATRDGGRDIIALKNGPTKAKYLIECKRYSKSRKVGIDVVQRLNGVVHSELATKGIVATTSRLTKPAQTFVNSTWQLEARDFDGLVDWLRIYEQFERCKAVGLEPPTL